MNRLKAYVIAILMLAPLFMPVTDVYAESQYMGLKGKGLGPVFISVQTNDPAKSDTIMKDLQAYMKSRLHEINIKSSYSTRDDSDAELTLSFHIGPVEDHEKFLGYGGQNKYLVFMELTLEQFVTLKRDPSIVAMVPTWTSDLAEQIDKKQHMPFVTNNSKFKKDVSAELKELMDEFITVYKSLHYQTER